MQSQGSPREMGLAANRGEDCLELPLLEWVELRQSRTLVQSLGILALYASMLIIISCYLFLLDILFTFQMLSPFLVLTESPIPPHTLLIGGCSPTQPLCLPALTFTYF